MQGKIYDFYFIADFIEKFHGIHMIKHPHTSGFALNNYFTLPGEFFVIFILMFLTTVAVGF